MHNYWPDGVNLKGDGGSTLNKLICTSVFIIFLTYFTVPDVTRHIGWPGILVLGDPVRNSLILVSTKLMSGGAGLVWKKLSQSGVTVSPDMIELQIWILQTKILSRVRQLLKIVKVHALLHSLLFQSSQSNNNVKWSAALDSERENLRGSISQ